ncbi:MAG: dihydrofolate reductase [Candidatus Lightella neohaematopini]|nr:dihydrofolate reductase [Candidatus Lightella neohaematopini]
MISIIVAIAKNWVIGINNTIPWNIPQDRLWFKKHTLHKTIIMGRNTYESIGYILPYRHNIILTNTIKNITSNREVSIVNTVQKVLLLINNDYEYLVIGGAQIYKLFFKYTNRLYITYIDLLVYGNIFFPTFNLKNWNPIFTKYQCCNKVNLCFKILERK